MPRIFDAMACERSQAIVFWNSSLIATSKAILSQKVGFVLLLSVNGVCFASSYILILYDIMQKQRSVFLCAVLDFDVNARRGKAAVSMPCTY